MGEFSPPLFLSPLLSFLFLIPQILIGSNTLLQKFTPYFKILDPRLRLYDATQHVHNLKEERKNVETENLKCLNFALLDVM